MDSASLYSRESIITEDPSKDREERQRGKQGVCGQGAAAHVFIAAGLCHEEQVGGMRWWEGWSFVVVEANQRFCQSFELKLSFQHEYLPTVKGRGSFFAPKDTVVLKVAKSTRIT